MTLYQIVSYLKQIALSSPYIRTAEEGSVYTIMNGNPHSKYSVFVVSQTQHRQDEIFDYYGLNLFVIDRLVDDLESNRLQTQSLAKEVLTNIILTLESKFYGITHNELQFHPFTEKFVDLTAGQYVQVTFQVPRNLICPDDYGIDFPSNYKLLPLNVEITENGVYEYSPVADFDGYDSVTLTINVPQSGYTQEDLDNAYESGITSGETYQKSLLESINITENGEYTSTNGYSAVTVNVPQSAYTSGYTQEDLDNAYASGETHQKSLLQDIEITHNGEYQVENGFDKVTVNVPQDSGQTIYNQTKTVEYSGNGEYTVTYDEGYTGLEAVNININVPQSAYTSGYTEQDLIDAYNSGITYQKSLLSAITITENGTYTSTNGYSAVTVNISGDTPTPPEPSGDTGYSSMYLTTISLTDGTINVSVGTPDSNVMEHRKNNGGWITGNTISTVRGDKVEYRMKKNMVGLFGSIRYSSNNNFIVYGNILSIVYKDDFVGKDSINSSDDFSFIFSGCSGLEDASNLILPIKSLPQNCYKGMFDGCSSLTGTPELIATALDNYCYQQMFKGCTSLTNAPEINDIYTMGQAVHNPFANMFQNCSNLTYIKCLESDPTGHMHQLFENWVSGVAASGIFIKKLGTSWPTGSSGIPENWTVIEE